MLERRRGSATARGFGKRQQAWSRIILGRDPICRGCQREPSRFADHIIPVPPEHRDLGDWSEANGQGLCPSCDGYKRAVEQRDPSFGSRLRAAGAMIGEPAPCGWRVLTAFSGER